MATTQWHIYADPQKVTVMNPAGETVATMAAVVLVDHKNAIRDIGVTLEDLEREHPLEWAKVKANLSIRTPLSTAGFDPLLAVYLIGYALNRAIYAVQGKQELVVFKPAIVLHLSLPGYEQIDLNHQHLFAYSLQKPSIWVGVRIADLTINQIPQPVKTIRRVSFAFTNGNLLAGMVSLFLGFAWIYRLLPERFLHQNLEFWGGLVLISTLIPLSLILMYLPAILLSFLWKRAFKRYLPDILSRVIMQESKFGVPGFLMNILYPSNSTE